MVKLPSFGIMIVGGKVIGIIHICNIVELTLGQDNILLLLGMEKDAVMEEQISNSVKMEEYLLNSAHKFSLNQSKMKKLYN